MGKNGTVSDWRVEKNFTDEDSGMTAQLRKDHSVDWPKYSVALGQMVEHDNGGKSMGPFIQILIDRPSPGHVALRFGLSRLEFQIQDLEEYVLAIAQKYEDDRLARMQEREQAENERQNQNTRRVMRPGKTARMRENKARRNGGDDR